MSDKKIYPKYSIYLLALVLAIVLFVEIDLINNSFVVITNKDANTFIDNSTEVLNETTQQGYITKLPALAHPITINGIKAVFLDPSDEWIKKMKQEDEKGFYIVADDSMYYVSMATTFLESKKIKVVHTKDRYLEFVKNNGSKIYLDRNLADAEGWEIILFDGTKDPLIIDMTVIQSEYEKYFK